MRILLAPAIAALAIGMSPAVSAKEVTITIDYNDLDLSNPADMKEFEDRIEDTIQRECKVSALSSQFRGHVDEACVSSARSAVQKELAKRDIEPIELAMK